MRELTFEEMDQVAGGDLISAIGGAIAGWAVNKALNYMWDNGGAYINYLLYCSATYGGGPFDYRLGS